MHRPPDTGCDGASRDLPDIPSLSATLILVEVEAQAAAGRIRRCLGWSARCCALVVIAMGAGCAPKSRAPAEEIEVSLVRVTHGARGDRVSEPRIDAIVAAPFATAGRFRRSHVAGEGVEGALWFDVETTAKGARRVELSVSIAREARVSPGGPGRALEAMVQVDSQAEAGASDDAAVAQALSLALGILDAQVVLERGEEARIPALLRSADPQIVLLALAWVRQRQRAEFLAPVVAALEHPHPDVAISAVETLGRIGDASHVGAILRQAPRLQIASSFRLYETLGRLGGGEAAAFLGFAARNEEDPALRSAARRALHSRGRPGEPGANSLEPPTAAARGHWRTP